MPPSWSTSVARKVTSFRSAAAWTFRTSSSSWSAASAGPDPRISSSVPSKWMNATVTRRCSGSWCRAVEQRRGGRAGSPAGCPCPGSTALERHERGRQVRRAPAGAGSRTPSLHRPGPAGGPAAVAGLITICPASAVPSIVTVVLAAGPVTISSRWEPPDQEEVEVARVDTHGHPQRRPSGPGRQPPDACAAPDASRRRPGSPAPRGRSPEK